MDDLLTVTFEAHHVGNNHHRRYEVVIGRDLLDDWTLTIRYGRVGQVSQVRRYASSETTVVRAMIRDRLLRRLSAPKRIGCPYRLATFTTTTGMALADWLPNDILIHFIETT